MPAASSAVEINRPIEVVFAFFTDPRNDQLWREHVISITPEGAGRVGARISQLVSGPGNRPIPADIEVTVFEPSTRYAFRVVAGPVRPAGEFRFSAVETGTRVEFSLTAELSGVKKLLISGAVQRSMDTEADGLQKAKAILEAPTGPR